MRPLRSTMVEEDQLAHVAACEHAAREPARLLTFGLGRESVGLDADCGNLVTVGKPLWQ